MVWHVPAGNRLILSAICCGLFAVQQVAAAPWISELWLQQHVVQDDLGQPVSLPVMIELSAVEPSRTVDLVIIDARDSDSRYGAVKQVIRVNAGSNMRLVTETPYPDNVSMGRTGPLGGIQALDSPPFDYTGSRTILLFDGQTNLLGYLGNIDAAGALLNGLTPVDALTLGPISTTRLWAGFPDRPIIHSEGIVAITRPMLPDVPEPWPSTYLSGVPDIHGVLHLDSQSYRLDPGYPNRIFGPPGMPEPASFTLLFGAVASWLASRPAIGNRCGIRL